MMDKFAAKTVSRVWSKPRLQQVRKDLKAQGFDVKKTKDGNGYELALPDGRLLLKAMNGQRGYLVRHVHNLFV